MSLEKRMKDLKKRKIILDVDPGIDDSLALLLALLSNQFEVLAITIGSGNVDIHQGAKNASKLLALIKQEHVPIYKGTELPLEIKYTDARDTHGEDGLGEAYFYDRDISQTQHAVDFIIDTLKKYPNEVTIFALGPLTNMANVIKKDSTVLSLAQEIRVMGGSYHVPGNCSPVAEYNFWCDPHAAKIFFKHITSNVYLYTLDVTYDVLFTPNMREMVRQLNTEVSQFVYNITRFYIDFHWNQERTLGCIINDPLVVADAMENIVTFRRAFVDVVEDGLARGESVVDLNEQGNVWVSKSVNKSRFFEVFLENVFKDKLEDVQLMIRKGMI